MKTIEELGVSPAPWKADDYEVYDAADKPVVCDSNTEADARLIAAAPDLYEALREAVEKYCAVCESHSQDGDRCLLPDNSCFQRWRKALEKAGGAE